jgi:large repetitive protein
MLIASLTAILLTTSALVTVQGTAANAISNGTRVPRAAARLDTTLEADGGTMPYTWAVTSGSLPAGLSLDASSGNLT